MKATIICQLVAILSVTTYKKTAKEQINVTYICTYSLVNLLKYETATGYG